MAMKLAHDLHKDRTEDVRTLEDVDFPGMLLPENILAGLSSNGFKKPSPIQLKAIPLGRCGFDLILQAKSGTGKTCVFSIIALEMTSVEKRRVQTLILAPTREIAVQVTDVIRSIGSGVEGLRVHSFIGGTPIEEDKKKLSLCHIAVGAPGRVRHLIEKGFMKPNHIGLLVLDEADKLMESSFIKDIKYFFSVLPTSRQVIVASATMSDELDVVLNRHMKSPVRVCPHGEGTAPILIGVRQVAVQVPEHPNVQQQLNLKVFALVKLLTAVSFQQCIVFSNYLTRAESICHELERRGWPCKHTAGILDQSERLEAFSSLVESRCRILLSTDLTARGVDAPGVDLVVNLDLPNNGATYLHRIGRAGRYGSYGLAATLVTAGTETCKLSQMLKSVGATAALLSPKEFPENLWNCDLGNFEQLGIQRKHDGALRNVSYNSDVTKEPKSEPSASRVTILTEGTQCISGNRVSNELGDKSSNSQLVGSTSVKEEDLSVLSNALVCMPDGPGCMKSLEELVKSCNEYVGESAPTSEGIEGGVGLNFAENFDRVLGCILSKSSKDLNDRLAQCKASDVETILRKLSLGESWPPEEVDPGENPPASQFTSWNMEECDVSLFEKSSKKSNEEVELKTGDSRNERKSKSAEKRVQRSFSDHDGTNVASILPNWGAVVDSGSCCSLSLRGSMSSCGCRRNTTSRHTRHDSDCVFGANHIKKCVHSLSAFNMWYQQIIFNGSQIQCHEYWKHMFQK